ncbi:hypothetical protein CERSUDRAFT_89486 [Gelatoporia subvermispora B]|uniref:Uncharacterized protein n=1 Tax=Ceriporiopsis subvermispora (strain B) TaxID=914234 RepID=M2QYT2_CERS8|nr:hypothetical protein CERSUDRAFT_89486 [Gelatoporia subvermispora B]
MYAFAGRCAVLGECMHFGQGLYKRNGRSHTSKDRSEDCCASRQETAFDWFGLAVDKRAWHFVRS